MRSLAFSSNRIYIASFLHPYITGYIVVWVVLNDYYLNFYFNFKEIFFMNIDIEKREIIKEILNVEDEWVIRAIKKLLDIDVNGDAEFGDEHKYILEERLEEYEKNPGAGINLDQLIEELKAENKL
jgi:hypothetical protein